MKFKNFLDKSINKINDDLGNDRPIGSHHYRAFVGPPQKYDLVAANQFNLLTSLGLREQALFLLDIKIIDFFMWNFFHFIRE